ncbi:vacuolar sorting protein 35 [Theileria annulata]|uniref:Vacuolar protein sorting-associated protein 35 n=1 Tax=Theileria annulata TaxID=5874 RepID=Q4UHY4_THEAN|nr:vacuolar sorting protein 35 [Theileria annulata]CAI73305.1 vacuolar sorting protein 35 homologue, putative [Theileria annulata]|eukprot:XP_953982.1 vacuolar sorting protein 35 homologue, putative [Theileria annulata]
MLSDSVVGLVDNYRPMDQGKMLEEAIFFVKEQSYYMKKAIEMEDVSNSLKHGSNIISELRTSSLSPIHYYELYMKVFNELEYLADFIGDHAKKTNIIPELYVSVQQATFILPRLYLLVMVGAHYIKSKKVTAKEILDDITELCKGIQHPMRGLFLRYYLVQICKDKLPDSDPDNENGFIDSFDFLMNNFCESIRLWIRLNTAGNDKKKLDKERLELGLLVGANLVRITQLEGVDINFYSSTALPRILSEIKSIDDNVAQKYLLDCLIQAFSDEFHIQTIDDILSACVSSVKSGNFTNDITINNINFCTYYHVDGGISILMTMMNRLSVFLTSNPESLPEGVDIFSTFQKHLSTINVVYNLSVQGNQEPEGPQVGIKGYLDLQAAFLEFITTLYPGTVEHVEFVLNKVVEVLSNILGDVVIEGPAANSIVKLLTVPIKALSLKALELSYNEKLISFLSWEMRKEMSYNLIDELVTTNILMDELSSFEIFFNLVSPLFLPFDEEKGEYISDHLLEKIKLEQYQICKLIQAIKCSDVCDQFSIYKDLTERILKSGSLRMKHTLPCLVNCSLSLLFSSSNREFSQTQSTQFQTPNVQFKNMKISFNHDFSMEILKYIHHLMELLQPISPKKTLKLLMLVSISVDEFARSSIGVFGENTKFMTDMKMMCLDFLMKACNCYEDEISGGENQVYCIKYMCSAVSSRITILDSEDYLNVAMLLAKYALNLIRLTQRCEVLCCASHLFNSPQYYNEQRLVWCLEKCVTLVETLDFYTPSKLVESLMFPLETSKYFKLKNTTKLVQNKLDKLSQLLPKDEMKKYEEKVKALQEYTNLLTK